MTVQDLIINLQNMIKTDPKIAYKNVIIAQYDTDKAINCNEVGLYINDVVLK